MAVSVPQAPTTDVYSLPLADIGQKLGALRQMFDAFVERVTTPHPAQQRLLEAGKAIKAAKILNALYSKQFSARYELNRRLRASQVAEQSLQAAQNVNGHFLPIVQPLVDASEDPDLSQAASEALNCIERENDWGLSSLQASALKPSWWGTKFGTKRSKKLQALNLVIQAAKEFLRKPENRALVDYCRGAEDNTSLGLPNQLLERQNHTAALAHSLEQTGGISDEIIVSMDHDTAIDLENPLLDPSLAECLRQTHSHGLALTADTIGTLRDAIEHTERSCRIEAGRMDTDDLEIRTRRTAADAFFRFRIGTQSIGDVQRALAAAIVEVEQLPPQWEQQRSPLSPNTERLIRIASDPTEREAFEGCTNGPIHPQSARRPYGTLVTAP